MAYTKTTLASVLLEAEIAALKAQAEAAGIVAFDPFAACCGVAWVRDMLSAYPGMTVEDLRLAFASKTDGDKGAWAAGLLSNQWGNLYSAFKTTLIAALHGDNCTHVVARIGKHLTAAQKAKIRTRFLSERKKSRREPSTDFDAAIKRVEA